MIFVFGAILQSIRITTDPEETFGAVHYAKHYKNSIGGKGALQALAAAKAGAKTALAGKMGDDELAKHILLRLRTHGVITSGVAKAEKLQTGTSIRIVDENRTILAMGASAYTKAHQLPMETLNSDSTVVLQTEINMEENSKLLATAKKAEATTILNLAPKAYISDEDLANLDYLIAPSASKKALNHILKAKHLTTIFISTDGSCELIVEGGPPSKVPKPAHEALNWKYPEGAEDTFCGTFAAGIDMGLSLEKAIERAHIAASLTASVNGAYDAIPFSDMVDECIKSLQAQKES